MKTINATSSFQDVKTAASALDLDVSVSSADLFELWKGDRYQGGFSQLEQLINELNTRIETMNLKRESDSRKADELNNRLAGATSAAVLKNGQVIGTCITTVRNGKYIDIASCFSSDGTPVNVARLKVSRSQRNMKKAEYTEKSFLPSLHEGNIIYA